MSVTVRFAPSPTGRIHVGNLRTALFNWLYAKRHGGRFILRLDDTDKARSTEAFAEGIIADLAWIGIRPDAVFRQSERFDRYEAAARKLIENKRLYPAFESPEELERRRKRQMGRGLPPVYDRAALKLSDQEVAALEAEGRTPHWRFLLGNFETDPFQPRTATVTFEDLCRGEQSVDLAAVSDPVLRRADGAWLYTLPSVVDDIDMGVTHVIRGEDHVTNAGVQIDIFHALGADAPVFAHHNLLADTSGQGLSKRLGALSVAGLREAGYEPEAVAAIAVLIGTSLPVEPIEGLDDLASRFDLSVVSRAPARFDEAELRGLNMKTLARADYSQVSDRLAALGVGGGEAFWLAVRGNLEVLREAADWWQIVTGPVQPVIEDEALAADALRLLPPEPWDLETWGQWTGAVKEASGKGGKALFHPLRMAITARPSGPELRQLLPLIGRTRISDRLSGRPA
ncbi:MAG: glutamate--tRNA ligase [Rhodobiaceae bacterium]|nr:glutamate--tRNA ligase [Rhodobiaceae bacterium]